MSLDVEQDDVLEDDWRWENRGGVRSIPYMASRPPVYVASHRGKKKYTA